MKVFRQMDWQQLKHEYQLDGKRLLPWESWNMPFGGAWGVVRTGTESLCHSHEEQELFIVVSGQAVIVVGDSRYTASKGDFVAIPSGSQHYIINDNDEDFHFFTIWWDEETCSEFMSKRREVEVSEHG